MTNPIDRERIAREVAEELGWKTVNTENFLIKGTWYKPDGEDQELLDDETRDTLIDARCRVGELESVLQACYIALYEDASTIAREGYKTLKSRIRLALREKTE